MAAFPQKLVQADPERLKGLRFVLTDMDDTLTYRGRLPPETFTALHRLRLAGLKVIPVTAAPAGWGDQMARMWPVDGVIAENGGLYFHAHDDQPAPDLQFWHGELKQRELRQRLEQMAETILSRTPAASLAADQPFRLTSLAFNAPSHQEDRDHLIAQLQDAGCSTTVNNLWVLGWYGDYTKLEMSQRLLADRFGFDLNLQAEQVLYVGDSLNDEPMFAALANSVGVSTVSHYLPQMRHGPTWITDQPGGYGFAELAEVILRARCPATA